jgi:hypothetical protein
MVDEEKNILHKEIDSSFGSILKNLLNIFECIKFNDNIILEDENSLAISSNMIQISKEIEFLLGIVNKLKQKILLSKEKLDFNKNNKKFDEILKYISKYENSYNKFNNRLKDYQEKKYYRMAQLILQDNNIK